MVMIRFDDMAGLWSYLQSWFLVGEPVSVARLIEAYMGFSHQVGLSKNSVGQGSFIP